MAEMNGTREPRSRAKTPIHPGAASELKDCSPTLTPHPPPHHTQWEAKDGLHCPQADTPWQYTIPNLMKPSESRLWLPTMKIPAFNITPSGWGRRDGS